MTQLRALSNKFNWLLTSVVFFRDHYKTILALGLIAAFGRVIQLGAFGKISTLANIFLEAGIETSRILLFLYVLGLSNIRLGAAHIKHFFIKKSNRYLFKKLAWQRLKTEWPAVILNLAGFLSIAWVSNYLIDLLAYETCLLLTLKKDGILAASSSEWTIILFFKNLSVIPLTLVFNGIFLLWITNKLKALLATNRSYI